MLKIEFCTTDLFHVFFIHIYQISKKCCNLCSSPSQRQTKNKVFREKTKRKSTYQAQSTIVGDSCPTIAGHYQTHLPHICKKVTLFFNLSRFFVEMSIFLTEEYSQKVPWKPRRVRREGNTFAWQIL